MGFMGKEQLEPGFKQLSSYSFEMLRNDKRPLGSRESKRLALCQGLRWPSVRVSSGRLSMPTTLLGSRGNHDRSTPLIAFQYLLWASLPPYHRHRLVDAGC